MPWRSGISTGTDPDLVTTNQTTANVSILLGNGTGAFNPAAGAPFAVGTTPKFVAVSDFNGDGIEDLAVANSASGSVTVLLGALSPTTSVLSTTSPLIIMLGQSVPLTLAVSDTGTAFNALTGTATFMDGVNTLGTASQTGSPYSFNAAALGLGTHNLTASYGGGSGSAASTSNTVTIMVTQESQTISFGTLSNVTFGVSPFGISATATSGLTVSFASATPAVCVVSAATVTIVAGGTCTITASQTGNTNYAAATPVYQSFTVNPAPQTITFDKVPNQIFGGSPFPVAAQSSALLPVSFASTTTAVCKIADDLVTLLTAGSCSIAASQAGNASYNPATTVTRSFTITQANPAGTLSSAAGSPFALAPSTVPFAVLVGDFNGDGIADLATATTKVPAT